MEVGGGGGLGMSNVVAQHDSIQNHLTLLIFSQINQCADINIEENIPVL